MAGVPQRHLPNGFFSTHLKLGMLDEVKKRPVFVDVGGIGDCGFRSVAAGCIDNFLTHPSTFNMDMLKQLLEVHFKYFPKHWLDLPGLVTPSDRMHQLLKTISMAELIQSMAYTMRQIAVNELCAKPATYQGAFVHHHEHTSPEKMRQPNTWIDESSIAALANVLNMPIEVQVVGADDVLRMRLHYNAASDKLGIALKLRNGHYIPRVAASERFNLVQSRSVHVSPALGEQSVNDPSLSEVLALIEDNAQQLMRVFDDTRKNLEFKINAGELSQDDLLTMYIRGMNHSDYLIGRVKYVGIEHGNEHFFNALTERQSKPNSQALVTGADKKVTQELVHALARAVSIGQMSIDEMFAPMDDEQVTCGSLMINQ